MRSLTLARAHGLFNLLGGVWPLLHMRSFEAVLGPKEDRWLVKTVAGLMVGNGLVQLTTRDSFDGLEQARRVGIGTAATLAAIDLTYSPRGRISKMYLLDAAAEVAWVLAWATPPNSPRPASSGSPTTRSGGSAS